MAKVSVKGMVIGGLTDIIATVVLTIPLVFYVIMDQLHAATKQPLEVAVTAALYASPILYGLQSLMSLGCSILGGYVAARVANHDELLNGLLASVLSVGLGVYPLINKSVDFSLLPALLLIASPLCSTLGGHLRRLQTRARASAQFHTTCEDERGTLGADAHGPKHASVRPARDNSTPIRPMGASRVFRGFLWTMVLKAFLWIITLLVMAAVLSNAGIDVIDLSKKLLGAH